MSEPSGSEFERLSPGERRGGALGQFLGEFWEFLRFNKKWWLLPFLGVLMLLGLLTWLAGTGAAPFIYTLF